MWPASMNALRNWPWPVKRVWSATWRILPLAFATSHISRDSVASIESGFSHRTFTPAFSAKIVGSLWNLFGVVTETPSRDSLSIISR